MESSFNLSPSDAHPETMDFLSSAWCNFAVQALQPEKQDCSLILVDSGMKKLESSTKVPSVRTEKSVKMDDTDFKSLPPWKSNDVKSWIWMQQAMHPELNYNSYSRRKWIPWKQMVPFKNVSIKKWWKEIKQRRKEDIRLNKAEVHAALSVAGLAAALAAIASENSDKDSEADKEAAIASAAALVATQCAKVAQAMGAKKEQLSSVICSAMSGTTTSDILTLTASAATSLRGAATLKARLGCDNRLNGSAPVLPIEDNHDLEFDFEKGRSILAKGAHLYIESPQGECFFRSVSIILNNEAKVILITRKLNLLKSKKESIVLNLHAELYKGTDSEDSRTCYLIVLRTNKGMFKLDMEDDNNSYNTWATTINHMLMLSTSFAKYDHMQFYKK